MDGEQLTDEDEKIVAERLLAYHPNSDDKIGCGFDSIMVSLHSFQRNLIVFRSCFRSTRLFFCAIYGGATFIFV